MHNEAQTQSAPPCEPSLPDRGSWRLSRSEALAPTLFLQIVAHLLDRITNRPDRLAHSLLADTKALRRVSDFIVFRQADAIPVRAATSCLLSDMLALLYRYEYGTKGRFQPMKGVRPCYSGAQRIGASASLRPAAKLFASFRRSLANDV